MRRILYLLPLLLLAILPYKVYSQSPQPMWQYFCMGNACVLTFSTQLVYTINITSTYISTNLSLIAFTVPESILQRQLQYCKTYDPFVTNNVSLLHCEFAWPAVVAIAYPNGTVINYWTQYMLSGMSFYFVGYDNITGLPQIFIFNQPSLSPGTYYLYVYYSSPYLFAGNSAQEYSIISDMVYQGGWLVGSTYSGVTNLYSINSASTIATLWAGSGFSPSGEISRILNVSYNPAYPVIIGANPKYYGSTYMAVVYNVTNSSMNSNINVCIVNPTYLYYTFCNITLDPGLFYDLKQVLINNGYDPNQYNKIFSISVYGGYAGGYAGIAFVNAIYLAYTPIS